MATVFISYRQTDELQRQQVRSLADRLRACGIEVLLDQLFLDEHPAGPNEGWDKWSSDCALRTEYVLIVGTQAWFECFEKRQPAGTGLGAACEADDLRHRIYEAGGIIEHIRIVLFDEGEAAHIPGKLRRYHRFHADHDFVSIVRWLGGTPPTGAEIHRYDLRTSIPHNLPPLQPFFGREDELRRIADALDPESRTWGALIDGPGGMGKTSLAVRAAYDASPDLFDRIAFVSLKSRELDDDGVRDLSGFLISGFAELFNELSRVLGHTDIAKTPEAQRPRLLLDALRDTRTLLILDNLESLLKRERDIVFTFVKRLPVGCKAILTSRGRIGSGAEELILEQLNARAALATLAALAETNSALARTSEVDRLVLYDQTSGNPLLLRWTAGQLGRGSCLTFADAIAYLRSCPEGNDPLEFIFGDLVEVLSDEETNVLCALIYFSLPVTREHITVLAGCSDTGTDHALRSLVNRSLVVPTQELNKFSLVPLVAEFCRKKRPEMVADTGERLEKRAYALIVENGYDLHDRYPVLEDAWPTVVAALRYFLIGQNDRLQTICSALARFLNFTGRWDERLALMRDAEGRAVASADFESAGWRTYQAGMVHYSRGESAEVLACADRAAAHWSRAGVGNRERAAAIRLRGNGHELAENYTEAISAYQEVVKLFRTLGREGQDVAIGLADLADVEYRSGDLKAAEQDYSESLRIARMVDHRETIASCTGQLAELAIFHEDWTRGEALAREALGLAENIGRLELIAANCYRLAASMVRQDKKTDAISYAHRAVSIFTRLGSSHLDSALSLLSDCKT